LKVSGAMNIYEKLVEVRKKIPSLSKDQEGAGIRYKYVSSSQVLKEVVAAFNEVGIAHLVDIQKTLVSPHTTKDGKSWYFTEIWTRHTLVSAEDPKEKVELSWYGQALDDGEKGVGKAATYDEKYFFMKLFNITTDRDDADTQRGRQGKGADPPRSYGGVSRPEQNPASAGQKNPPSAGTPQGPKPGAQPPAGPSDPSRQSIQEKFKAIIPPGTDLDRLAKFIAGCAGHYKQTENQVRESAIAMPTDFFQTFQVWEKKHFEKKGGEIWCPNQEKKILDTICEKCPDRPGCPSLPRKKDQSA